MCHAPKPIIRNIAQAEAPESMAQQDGNLCRNVDGFRYVVLHPADIKPFGNELKYTK